MKIPLSIISKVTTLADGCVRVQLDLQETTPELMAQLFTMKQGGKLIEIETDGEGKVKSPSKRLKDIIYVYWFKNGQKGEFENYYTAKMEGIISSIANRLN